jgi:hypothetical protein
VTVAVVPRPNSTTTDTWCDAGRRRGELGKLQGDEKTKLIGGYDFR